MVVLFGLSLLSLLGGNAVASQAIPSDCRDSRESDNEACAQPIEPVVAVTPRSFYTAKIRCYDCPYYGWHGEPRIGSMRELMFGDHDLFFNITLSPDRRSVLLNGEPFFPKLSTIPQPPTLRVPQLRPDFSYRNLSYALECRNPSCPDGSMNRWLEDSCLEWCHQLQLDIHSIDYLYITKEIEYKGNESVAEAKYWEFNIDAIGAFSGYVQDPKHGFDSPSQKMLKVIVAGIEQEQRRYKSGQDTLFSPLDDEEKAYDYYIDDVKLVDREFKFPPRTSLSFREKVSRFFGNDIWQSEGRLVYMRDEWSYYGKIGTLRDAFDDFIHWVVWELVAIIVSSVVGGLLALYGVYRLFFWIQEQRELMKWDGMDDVWDKLRREREEEESALLNGQYRDDPDEGSSHLPQYTDGLATMKPLPTKPLPEKPLPDVPLIDT